MTDIPEGIDLGNDLPDGFLGNFYDDILQTEIKMRSADRFDRVSEIADLLPDPTVRFSQPPLQTNSSTRRWSRKPGAT